MQTPRGANGAHVPASKGKLTIKISEARGLRKCRDPYVVVVFQRSELISGGPRPTEIEEPLNAATSAMGGIPIGAIPAETFMSAMSGPNHHVACAAVRQYGGGIRGGKQQGEACVQVLLLQTAASPSLALDHAGAGRKHIAEQLRGLTL